MTQLSALTGKVQFRLYLQYFRNGLGLPQTFALLYGSRWLKRFC